VGGSKEKGETGQNNTIWEDESFDADSPNVWQTRTVVDLEESGSPTFHCEWNLETEEDSVSSKESGNIEPTEMFRTDTYISFPDLVTSSSTSGEEETANGKTPQNSEQEENENSREESSEINGTKEFVRRLSPEGAENSALNALMTSDEGNTDSYLLVPDKRFVSEAQRRDALGSCLGYSPSGRMDDKDYWTLNDDIDGKEVVDGGCQDRVPLIDPGKARVMYTPEEGFEEMEEGVVVPCFSCDHCVVL